MIAWLRANSNKASAGVTTVSYRMLMALFQKETGTRFTLVPYRGFPRNCRTWPRAGLILCLRQRLNFRLRVQGTSKLTP